MRASAHLRAWSTLPQRIRAGCDAATFFRGARWDDLCHSAFARVATCPPDKAAQLRPLATAHSRGLRPASHLKAGITRFFATAHSRGLRRFDNPQKEVDIVLCHSAFARVATQPLRKVNQPAVPLPQRIRAGCDNHDKKAAGNGYSLPQRIRAGCDKYLALLCQI